jgi:hypothetical protein
MPMVREHIRHKPTGGFTYVIGHWREPKKRKSYKKMKKETFKKLTGGTFEG